MRRSIVATLLLALVSACADSTAPADSAVAVTGTFSLVTVNGAPLPYTGTNNAEFKYEVLQDTYTLTSAGTWTETFRYRFTDKVADTVAVDEWKDAGTYERNGSSIHLISADTDMSGSFDGSALTFILQGGFELIYRR
jgi:hypothetical protein